MAKDIKKLNKSIASFMLVSLALSSTVVASVNENLISNTASGVNSVSKITMELYGVPAQITPINPPPVMDLYGVPTQITPINPPPVMDLYAPPVMNPPIIHVDPVPKMLYAPPIINPQPVPVTPEIPPMALYAPPVINQEKFPIVQPAYGVPIDPIVQPAYAVPVRESEIAPRIENNFVQTNDSTKLNEIERMKQVDSTTKDIDTRTPVGYRQPVIIPRYYYNKEY